MRRRGRGRVAVQLNSHQKEFNLCSSQQNNRRGAPSQASAVISTVIIVGYYVVIKFIARFIAHTRAHTRTCLATRRKQVGKTFMTPKIRKKKEKITTK